MSIKDPWVNQRTHFLHLTDKNKISFTFASLTYFPSSFHSSSTSLAPQILVFPEIRHSGKNISIYSVSFFWFDVPDFHNRMLIFSCKSSWGCFTLFQGNLLGMVFGVHRIGSSLVCLLWLVNQTHLISHFGSLTSTCLQTFLFQPRPWVSSRP